MPLLGLEYIYLSALPSDVKAQFLLVPWTWHQQQVPGTAPFVPAKDPVLARQAAAKNRPHSRFAARQAHLGEHEWHQVAIVLLTLAKQTGEAAVRPHLCLILLVHHSCV